MCVVIRSGYSACGAKVPRQCHGGASGGQNGREKKMESAGGSFVFHPFWCFLVVAVLFSPFLVDFGGKNPHPIKKKEVSVFTRVYHTLCHKKSKKKKSSGYAIENP